MLELLIEYHKKLFVNNVYEFIDPNFKSNSVIRNYKLTQEEIIQEILENKSTDIEIKYFEDCVIKYSVIKYSLLNKNIIKFIPTDPNSVHLLRLVGLKKIPNYLLDFDIEVVKDNLYEMLIEINNYLNLESKLNLMDFCTVCGKELDLKGLNKISCCELKFCKISSKHIVMDNRITDMYKKDPFLCELLIQILITGTTHPKEEKIFKPFPQIKNISTLEQLKTLISNQLVNLDIKKIASSSNDIDLHRTIGTNAYSIISNAISDNYFSLSTIESFQSELLNIGKITLENNTVFNCSDVKFVGLNYSYEIESKFKKEYFLFHGSQMHSWYPIIKNGLKVMSGTEFQVNGTAHGHGIYLSDQFSMSLGYSGMINNKSPTIVGVFEIAGGIEQHKKSANIFVVSNEQIMLLRYLIVINGTLQSKHYQELSDYFVKYLGSINKLNDKKSINIKNKRLNAEMKLLNSNNNVFEIKIIEETTNWKIILNEIKGNKIVLNIYFNDYPKLPPKMSLEADLNPIIKKNICDNNSNIIISEINPSNWEITNNLSKIVDILYNCISNTL